MLVHDLSDEDKELCIQLLQLIERRFSGLFQKQKNKNFETIYGENMRWSEAAGGYIELSIQTVF